MVTIKPGMVAGAPFGCWALHAITWVWSTRPFFFVNLNGPFDLMWAWCRLWPVLIVGSRKWRYF